MSKQIKQTLRFTELKHANKIRCETAFKQSIDDWIPEQWGNAIAGETGEACNLIKKLGRGDDVNIEDIGKELADIVIYADLTAQRLGLDLGRCVIDKFNETSVKRGSNILLVGETIARTCGLCGQPNDIGEMCQSCGDEYHSASPLEYDTDFKDDHLGIK